MSYFYNYYIGYEKGGKIYPWGPYTANGSLTSALTRSRNFASDLYEEFNTVRDNQISEELHKAFEYDDGLGKIKLPKIKYLPVGELPSGSYISRGYFLTKDIEKYENDPDSEFEGEYDKISPLVYASKLENQLKFGTNKPKDDGYGGTYREPDASEYTYYAYPNYNSKEYEASLLRIAVYTLESYHLGEVKYVILETEG